jgi:hypothetical protein
VSARRPPRCLRHAFTVIPYYYGWHPFGFGLGFGFFGFLGTLLFFLLIFALIRAIVFGGRRRWGGPGWGGPGWGGHDYRGWRGSAWESRARETFEDWHREAHGERPASGERSGPTSDNPNQA